ncbi:hypothetical protein OESDEN_23988, partial [Oesophagostomum dentatum]
RSSVESLTIGADLRFLALREALQLQRHTFSFSSEMGFADSELFDFEEVQKVRELNVLLNSDFIDDQFYQLRGEELSLSSWMLTSGAINRLFRLCQDGRRRIKMITISTGKRNPMVEAEVFDGTAAVKCGLRHRIEGVHDTLIVQFSPYYLHAYIDEPEF